MKRVSICTAGNPVTPMMFFMTVILLSNASKGATSSSGCLQQTRKQGTAMTKQVSLVLAMRLESWLRLPLAAPLGG
ncbi:hypothetical protein HaLaN_00583 [Haematococcus lacustris]|uniref:Secreted protein n=1 Tax=Haematococcus lacustris TaxID=44745 RepID=A0A699Y7J0_HAELA|nr:hypothetical protein HaLaN_00583 [Haematococcus lacustris]